MWTAPKIDWAGTDTVAETDLNRIEENIYHRQYFCSGVVGGTAARTGSETYPLAFIPVSLPATGGSIILHRASWNFSVEEIALRVYIPPYGVLPVFEEYAPSPSHGDNQDFNFTLASVATSDLGAYGYIAVLAANTVAALFDLGIIDTWALTYSIRANT